MLAHLRYPVQPRLAPGGVLPRHETQPSRQLAPAPEALHRRRQGLDGLGGDRSDPGIVISCGISCASVLASTTWREERGLHLIEDSMDGHSLPATSKTDSITPISCRDVGDLPASAQPHDPPETGPCIVGLSRNACLARSCSGARSSSGLKRRPSRRRRAKHRPWSGSTRYRRRNPCWRRSPLVQTP